MRRVRPLGDTLRSRDDGERQVIGVAHGFAIITVIVLVGCVLGRTRVLGENAQLTLSRLTFYVSTPALLFGVLAESDFSTVFSWTLVLAAVSAAATGAIYLLAAKLWLRRPTPDAIIGGLATSYVNSANLGLPIATYVLHDTSVIAPLLLYQIVAYGPLAVTVLDISTSPGRVAGLALARRAVGSSLRNPIVVAAALGLFVALTDLQPPSALLEPVRLIGEMAVPGALLIFGIALMDSPVLRRDSPRVDVALASTLKLLLQPLIVFLLARFAIGESGQQLYADVILATLPTAQTVLVYATHYQRGIVLARDTAFVTTVGAIPAMLLVSALLT